MTIPGEADEDKEIRKEMAFKTMESEVRILKNKSKRNEADFIKIDQEMSEVIGRKATGEVYDSLFQLWELECRKEEEKSDQIWKKTQNWLDNYENNFGTDIFITERRERMGHNDSHGKPAEESKSNQRASKTPRGGYNKRQQPRESNRPGNGMSNDNPSENHSAGNKKSGPFTHNGTTHIGTNVRESFLGRRPPINKGGGIRNRNNRNHPEEETRVKQVV